MGSRIFATKSIEELIGDSETRGHRLKKALSAFDLIAIGIGCIIGTGIFVLTGKTAIENSGPGIVISFVICGIACIFAALCYAEFASLIPIAGSAYTFSYASLGEITAWIIGWDLILEYGVATAAVANGWSSHFVNFLQLFFGINFPNQLALGPWETYVAGGQTFHGIVNVPAVLISLVITWLLIVGIKESARFNNIIVSIKIAVAIFFIGIGFFYVNPSNWSPIVPNFVPTHPTEGVATASLGFWGTLASVQHVEVWKLIAARFGTSVSEGFGGWAGIFLGAAIIFFAYIGFDAVSTTAEEAKNPQRDLPLGIVGSLVICTILYILMSAVFTGIVRCDGTLTLEALGPDKGAPLVYAFKQVKAGWVSDISAKLIDVGALCGITSVLLVTMLGQSRIFFAMGRDGLLPEWISRVHPRYETPFVGTLLTGIAVAIVSGVVPLGDIAEMANIGTLFAFVLVSGGIIFLRKAHPDKKAAFQTPLVPLVPIVSILFCIVLMMSLPLVTWERFVVWLVLGLFVYFIYGIRASRLQQSLNRVDADAA